MPLHHLYGTTYYGATYYGTLALLDAAAADYAQRQQAVDGGNVRVVELGTDGVMCDVAPPAPVCSLPVLPAALFETRHISLEGCYRRGSK